MGPVNRARLPGVIRWLVVQHRQGWPGNCDASLSLLWLRGVCAIGACALRVCVARRDFADNALPPRVGGLDGWHLRSRWRSSADHGHIGCTPGLAPGNVRIGRVCRSVRARHLRQHLSNGRIMKRAHPGGPRATRMESSNGSSTRDQYRAQKPENRANRQPFTIVTGSVLHPHLLTLTA